MWPLVFHVVLVACSFSRSPYVLSLSAGTFSPASTQNTTANISWSTPSPCWPSSSRSCRSSTEYEYLASTDTENCLTTPDWTSSGVQLPRVVVSGAVRSVNGGGITRRTWFGRFKVIGSSRQTERGVLRGERTRGDEAATTSVGWMWSMSIVCHVWDLLAG